MLDIDVAEQLFPNWFSILTQLCATGVLFLFVKKFLWSTAEDIIAKRKDLMQSRLTNAERLQEEAKADREASAKELKEVQVKAREMIDSAKKQANSEKDRIIKEANTQAASTLEKANIIIEKQKQELRKDLQKEIVDVALAASAKLLGESDLGEQDKRSIESFVKEISNEPGK